ncbi:sigma-54-dependent Fis family transcriptional regulator [Vibrio ponticus]|uniref:Sigma-54-dependent Fis family transcriptional regulator n=1 Tax=Vibrio ponticus TaxID=265668 RepID=A0A3N3DWF7_9VIBR|nr:sigma-54 dependent transcriptional regulator [Vibrio ponticus]ROV58874.1 sigma-54-dependent Fis family transcriptional regulator [Vibrio ponticus]
MTNNSRNPITNKLLIGKSPEIKTLLALIEKYAACEAEVLIQGETGSGKGVCARLLHQLSARKHHPFIEVNCGAIPSGLVASELFGHKRGAFTGALFNHTGFIKRAERGTLFLDEVSDMPPDLQVSLLHFLDQKKIHTLGSDVETEINSRIIAASHVDLMQQVENGNFREDLYYRLNILPLYVPALRERADDIILLSNYFLSQIKTPYPLELSSQARDALLNYSWPGNVRELKNVLTRAAVVCEHGNILGQDLGLHEINHNFPNSSLSKAAIKCAIEENPHNMSAVARQLDISRTTLYRLIKKYQLSSS